MTNCATLKKYMKMSYNDKKKNTEKRCFPPKEVIGSFAY